MRWGVDVLSVPPEPRKMASRPVAWIVATMAEGAAEGNMLDHLFPSLYSQTSRACVTVTVQKMGRTCAFDGHELIF